MIRARVVLLAIVAAGFAPAQDRALSIVLLVDLTTSVSDAMATLVITRQDNGDLHGVKAPTDPKHLFAKAIEEGFIQGLNPADRVRFGIIARTTRFGPEFGTDRAALRRTTHEMLDVPEAERYGPSPVWDAVDAAVISLEREPGRRAVVLITDGLSTGNRIGVDALIAHAGRSRVSVSVIGEWFGQPRVTRTPWRGTVGSRDATRLTPTTWRIMTWPFGNPPDVNLRRIASATGGVFVADGGPTVPRWRECGQVAYVPQCAGQDPAPSVALTRILNHLHHP